MISASEFRNGVTIEYDGDIYVILDFQHVKPGKGAAFVRTKLKNLRSGGTTERTFRPNEKMGRAHIERQDMQYLYNDGTLYHFMDTATFEQISINASDVGNSLDFVKENEMVKILSYNNKVLGIEPPTIVELEVTETEPGVRGDTATGATKTATLQTGVTINVPLFINNGDILKVDTRSGEYVGRA